jgi:CBS domain containing-hemolysin-like protein
MHVFGHNVNHVDPDCSLDVLLEAFKRESTHLALVKTVERDEDTVGA